MDSVSFYLPPGTIQMRGALCHSTLNLYVLLAFKGGGFLKNEKKNRNVLAEIVQRMSRGCTKNCNKCSRHGQEM